VATRGTVEVAPSWCHCDSAQAGVRRDSGTVWYAHLLAPLRVASVSSVPRLLCERASSIAASLRTCARLSCVLLSLFSYHSKYEIIMTIYGNIPDYVLTLRADSVGYFARSETLFCN
jgi:hypothetical protein